MPGPAIPITSSHAVSPSACVTSAPVEAATVCCTQPINDEAAPARSGNGCGAPANACGIARPRPNR